MKKKKEVLDKNEELASTWRHCALSHNPLRQPIVACEKGRLFNKESILEHLIDKGDNEIVSHIRSLKDVKELNLTSNPAYKDYGKEALIGGESVDYGNAMFICPVIGLEMNGRWRFVLFWRCGCVVSEKVVVLRGLINGRHDEDLIQLLRQHANKLKNFQLIALFPFVSLFLQFSIRHFKSSNPTNATNAARKSTRRTSSSSTVISRKTPSRWRPT